MQGFMVKNAINTFNIILYIGLRSADFNRDRDFEGRAEKLD